MLKISGRDGAQGSVQRHERAGARNEIGSEVSQHDGRRKLSQVRNYFNVKY